MARQYREQYHVGRAEHVVGGRRADDGTRVSAKGGQTDGVFVGHSRDSRGYRAFGGEFGVLDCKGWQLG
jgi:hypothetical protein